MLNYFPVRSPRGCNDIAVMYSKWQMTTYNGAHVTLPHLRVGWLYEYIYMARLHRVCSPVSSSLYLHITICVHFSHFACHSYSRAAMYNKNIFVQISLLIKTLDISENVSSKHIGT